VDFQRYACGQTNTQIDTKIDTVIAILYWEQSDETNLNVGFVMNIQQWRVTVVANCPLLLLLLLMRMLIVMV